MYGIIQDILCAAEIGVPFLFAGRILEERKQKLPVRLLWFLCLGINMVMLILQRRIVMYSRWYLLVCIPFSAVLLKWRFRVRWRNAFLGMAIYFETLYVLDLFLVIVCGMHNRYSGFFYSLLTIISVERISVLLVSRVIVCVLTCFLVKKREILENCFRNWKIFLLIPVLQYLGLHQCDRIFLGTAKEQVAIRNFFVFIVLYLATIILLVVLYIYRKSEYERKLAEERTLLLEQYCKSILAWNKERDILLHDMKNHFLILEELIQTERKEKALEYLKKIGNHVGGFRRVIQTGNSVIDAILGMKISEALPYGIDIQVITGEIKESFVEDQDWCALFANLLDNAIEACKEVQGERKIRIKLDNQPYGIMIQMENSCVKKSGEDERLTTTKKDKLSHGFGTKSIGQIVDRYNGSFHYEFQEGKFIADVILYR